MANPSKGLYGSSIGENMVRVSIAELLGTYFLVLAGTAVATAAILGKTIAGPGLNSLSIALAFGLILVALIGALGHISGAHFNPAVTLGLATTGKFPWKYVPAYIISQFAGAILASLTVLGMFGHKAITAAQLGATSPTLGVHSWQALLAEIVITFLLMLVIISVATDERVSSAVVGTSIGFVLAAGIMIAGPISGGAANPARALAPMIVSHAYTGWWIYVIGPIVGAILAALIYSYFLAEATQPDAAENPDSAPAPRIGKLVNKDSIVYLVDDDGLYGFPDTSVFVAWNLDATKVTEATEQEKALPILGNVPMKEIGFSDPLEQIKAKKSS